MVRFLTICAGLAMTAVASGMICPEEAHPSYCVNLTAAQAPRGVKNGEYTINVDQYVQWPLTLSFTECSDMCTKTKGCGSFQYLLMPPDAYDETSVNCNLFFKPISSYKVPCSTKDSFSAASYYDKGCSQPKLNTRGDVPASPSNNTVSGTCNGGRQWGGKQFQWARDSIRSGHLNSTQKECRNLCHTTPKCKSYYWANMLGGNFIPANSSHGQPWPYNSLGYGPNQCLLLSQPVYEYTKGGFDYLNSFWDVHCPISHESE